MMTIAMLALQVMAGFTLTDIKDPLDDGVARAAVIAQNKGYFSAICPKEHDQPGVAMEFPEYVGNLKSGILAGGQRIDYRIDDRPYETAMWDSNGRTVSATRPDQEPVKFMVKLKGSRRLYLRTYDYTGNAIQMQFDYEDPSSAIDDVLSRCGFGPDGKRIKRKR